MARNPIEVSLVIGLSDFLFQGPVNGSGRFFVSIAFNGPTVFAVKPFTPPPIQNTEIGNSVERSFFTTSAAGFERGNGIVQPYIHPGDKMVGNLLVVVFNKSDLPAEFMGRAKFEDLADEVFPRLIG